MNTQVDTFDVFLDTMLLSLCVWREARGESKLGKRLVAWTIKNRSTDAKHRWPTNPRDVVLQKLQFSSFNANDPNVTQYPLHGDPTWGDCVVAANEAMSGLPPLTTANHYHVIGLTPAWRDDSKVVATEGHHVFYCL